MSDGLTMDQNSGSSKWNLVQLGFISFYTAGIHGTTSLPYYIYNHQKLFLVAYYILLILICIPICYVQIKLGAIYRRGIVGIFSHLIPILKGVAVALLVMTYIRCLMNGLELSYSLFYAFVSFGYKSSDDDVQPSSQFFSDSFLQKSEHIGKSGYMIWYISFCLLATWLIIYLLSFKGMAALGKISYVLSPVIVVLLMVLLVYGYTSENLGRTSEFKHYEIHNTSDGGAIIELDSDKPVTLALTTLQSPKPWIDALLLHVSSIGLWSGILPTIGTQLYNRKVFINAGWSILLITYGVLHLILINAFAPYFYEDSHTGFAAAAKGAKPGLFFVIVTTFTYLRKVPIIAFCFHICIFLLGMLHVVLHLIMIWDTLLPSIPTLMMKYVRRREFLIAVVCCFSFIISLPFASQAGVHMYLIVNSYVDRLIFTLIIISMVPIITGYIKQEYQYLPVERAFMSFWYGLASLIPAAVLIYYFAVYVYPVPVVGYNQRWAETIGWVMAAAPIVLGVILGAVHAIYQEEGSFKQRCIQALKTDSLRTTDSANEYDTTETYQTGMHASKSPSNSHDVSDKTETETEVVMKPPEEGDVDKV